MCSKVRFLLSGLALLALLFGAGLGERSVALAQSGGTVASINGAVLDQTGAALGGATVKATNLNTNVITEVVCGEDGSYAFLTLTPGSYEVRVEVEGFKPQVAKLALALGTAVTAKFQLTVAPPGEIIVEVNGASQISRENTESSSNIDNGRIDNLPINKRDFLTFSLTTPRVSSDRNAASTGVTESSGISFNAQSTRFNSVTIDGVDNNNVFAGAVRTTFSQDAVQEYQVVADSFSAEFGRALGGIINIVTKGGGNENHGTVFFVNRNEKLAARNAFAAIKPDFKRYQFGATIGGPIKKDKYFYFLSFERNSTKDNNIVTLPDDAVLAAQHQGYNVRNGAIPFSFTETTLLGRVDAQLSPVDRLNIRYNFGGRYNGNYEPFGQNTSELTGSRQRVSDNSISFNNIFTSQKYNLVNETRFLFNRREFLLQPNDDSSQVQITNPDSKFFFGSTLIGNFPYNEKSFNIVDNVSLPRGKHTFKFGGDVDYHSLDGGLLLFGNALTVFIPFDFAQILGDPILPAFTALQAFDPALRTPAQKAFLTILSAIGPATFPGFPARVPIADLAIPVAFVQGFGDGHVTSVKKSFSAFAQDEYKPTSKLLIKAGVRYDITRVEHTPNNNGNFAPRLALNYRPTEKLGIRATYGLFFGSLYIGQVFPGEPTRTGASQVPITTFPFSILPFNQPKHRFPLVNQAGALPPGFNLIPQLTIKILYDPTTKASYTQQSTLGFDYNIDKNTTVSATYVFIRGLRLFAERYTNPVVRPDPSGNPTLGLINGRKDPTKGQISLVSSASDSYYHGVTLSIDRKFSNNFSLLANYTLSKAIDNNTDVRIDIEDGPINGLDLGAERSLSVQDARHRFVASGIWDLNSYTKNKYLKGFQLSGIFQAESGHPYNLIAGVDLNQDGDIPSFDRPILNGVQIPRNVGVLPGFAQFDMRLTRSVNVKEKYRIVGFFEVFNMFNRVNISDARLVNRVFPPGRDGTSALPPRTGANGRFIVPEGRKLGAFDPRQFQFGLRFLF